MTSYHLQVIKDAATVHTHSPFCLIFFPVICFSFIKFISFVYPGKKIRIRKNASTAPYHSLTLLEFGLLDVLASQAIRKYIKLGNGNVIPRIINEGDAI